MTIYNFMGQKVEKSYKSSFIKTGGSRKMEIFIDIIIALTGAFICGAGVNLIFVGIKMMGWLK